MALALSRSTIAGRLPFRRSDRPKPIVPAVPPPLSPKLAFVRSALVMLVALGLAVIVHLWLVSGLQYRSAQTRVYDAFRAQLAQGVAPTGPTDNTGVELPLGAPVAHLEIRSIGLSAVVLEGTTAEVLFDGPGHRRDTPLPGQYGTSVLFGRKTAYGAPFGDITDLRTGDAITVTTGQGAFEYEVVGVRRAGDPIPEPSASGARLLLVTADGSRFLPRDVVRVDADLVGTPAVGNARLITAAALPPDELANANQTDTLWALALWLQAVMVLSVGAVWAWFTWGRARSWVIVAPPLALAAMSLSSELVKLAPNLL